jgi:hypothetical protein
MPRSRDTDAGVFQRPALDLINELRRGKVASDLTEQIHELIARVSETGKKGQLSLVLTFDPDGKVGEEETPRINVTDVITVKAPRRTVRPSLFYLSDEGNLQRTDPNQQTAMSIRDVSDPDRNKSDRAQEA